MNQPISVPVEITDFLGRVFVDARLLTYRGLRAESLEEAKSYLLQLSSLMDALHNFPGEFAQDPTASLVNLVRCLKKYEQKHLIQKTFEPDRVGRYSGELEQLLKNGPFVLISSNQ